MSVSKRFNGGKFFLCDITSLYFMYCFYDGWVYVNCLLVSCWTDNETIHYHRHCCPIIVVIVVTVFVQHRQPRCFASSLVILSRTCKIHSQFTRVITNQWAVFESHVHLCKTQYNSNGVDELLRSCINF